MIGRHVALRTGLTHTDGREIVVVADPCAPIEGRHVALRTGRTHTDGREIVEVSRCRTDAPQADTRHVAMRTGLIHTDGREILIIACRTCVVTCSLRVIVRGRSVLLAGATVTIQKDDQSFTLTTDSTGVVEFPDITEGEWTITVSHPRYQPATRTITLECPAPDQEFDLTTPAPGYVFPGLENAECLGVHPIPQTLYYTDSLIGSVALTYHDTLPADFVFTGGTWGIAATLRPDLQNVYVSAPVELPVPYYYIDGGADMYYQGGVMIPCRPGSMTPTAYRAQVRVVYSPCIGRLHVYHTDIRRDYVWLGHPFTEYLRVSIMNPTTYQVVACPTESSTGQRTTLNLPCRLGIVETLNTHPPSELTNLNTVRVNYLSGNSSYLWTFAPFLINLPAGGTGTPFTASTSLHGPCVLPITWTLSE